MSNITEITVRARMAIVQAGKILLIPHTLDDGSINWHLPGGGVYPGEAIRDAARRELEEETGLIVKIGDVLHVYDVIEPERTYHGLHVIFAGQVIGGEIRAEIHPIYGKKEAQWLTLDDLEGKTYQHTTFIHRLLEPTS